MRETLVITAAITILLPACASQDHSLKYLQIGMSDDEASRVLSLYLTFLPNELERGTATVSSCVDADIEFDCDYFIEHESEACNFGTYVLPNACLDDQSICLPFMFVLDERSRECANDAT